MQILTLVIFTIFVNQSISKIIVPGTLQNEKLAEIYSDVELTCSLASKKGGNQLYWRKIDGVFLNNFS